MIDITLPPKNQTTLVGFFQEFERLKSLEQANRLHPAWLLSGQRGIGKATFAYRFARYILAESTDNPDFYTMLINQGSHPNLFVMERSLDEDGKLEGDIKVDQVRKFINFARQSPAIPGWRIVIIDAMEELNRNATNSLLKILEEPPSKLLFLMVCHSMGRLLPTIRSRCSVLTMSPLTADEMRQANIDIDPLIVQAASGSLGQAIALKNFNLPGFCDQVFAILDDLNQGRVHRLTSYIATLDKKDKSLTLIPEILEWISREATLLANGVEANYLVKKISCIKSSLHWAKLVPILQKYFDLAKNSYPDPTHLIQGAFLLMNRPDSVYLD